MKKLLTIIVTTFVALATLAEDSATLITNARIFDGNQIIEATDLLIEGDTIVQLGSNLEAPDGATTIDAAGQFIMPGMIDAHTHTFDESMLQQSAMFGVTTTLDMFTAVAALEFLRNENDPTRADIFTSGTLITAPGGHGTQFGLAIPTITEPEEAQEFVDARIAEGSDYIKIVYDDGSELGMTIPTISLDTLEALIAAAHQRDKLAVVHIHAFQAAKQTIARNADGLVHTFIDKLPDDSLSQLMSEKGSFMIPTLTVIESVCGRRGGATLVKDEALDPLIAKQTATALHQTFPIATTGPKRDFDIALRSVKQLHDAGVPILAGTDAPNPGTAHGISIHREVELLVEAGLQPIDALRSATSVPANEFGLDDRGTIAVGQLADLILIDGDPTSDITDTRHITVVWKGGYKLDRDALRQRVAAERERAQEEIVKRDLISDFEQDEITSEFGSGWSISTDSMMGGQSTAEMSRVDRGAADSAGALRINGEIAAGSQFPWSGVMFSPSEVQFTANNLSANAGITFQTRGDGQTYIVMVFAESLGRIPARQTFETTDEWSEVTFDWSDFSGVDGSDIMAVIFSAQSEGEFWFELDDVRLK